MRGKTAHAYLAIAGAILPILSSMGSRCFKNSFGFSLIGKCPRPFMIVTSQPAMLLATSSVSSGVHE